MKRAIVIGSAAGGAMAARELAAAFDVTVVEAGPEFKPFGGNLERLARIRSSGLFIDPRMIRALFPVMHVKMVADRMALVYGVATGGTTTLATANALRCDDELQRIGIDLGPEFDALFSELPISTEHERRWRPVTRELFSACDTLGLKPAVTPKLVDDSRCVRCGRCVLGCGTGAKWDSRNHLRQAVARGASLLTGVKAERLLAETSTGSTGRATGVLVRRKGHTEVISADLVVLAAGGLGTPAILARSGLPAQDRLFVDPVLCVAAPAEGCLSDREVPMPFYVQGDGYIISPYFDYLSFFFERTWRRPRHDIVSLMIKFADSETGSVSARQKLSKGLSSRDKRRMASASESCVEILTRFGARRDSVFLGMLNGGHPGGTMPLTGLERDHLHADELPANVYVADASLLPRSLGKPPSLTIMALARRVASVCKERFA